MSRLTATLRWLLFPLVIAGVIFLAAGRIDLPMIWAVLAVLLAFMCATALLVDPTLLQERQRPGTENKDRLTRVLAAPVLFSHWILVGLDVGRFHWSGVPLALQVAGLVGYALALSVLVWAMAVNRFYSSVVRIQTDRGHVVIDGGPYRIVRHPGYFATMFGCIAGGLALGSWVGMMPLLLFMPVFFRRMLLEDRMLHDDLPGYAEYARRVRYRLLPGVF